MLIIVYKQREGHLDTKRVEFIVTNYKKIAIKIAQIERDSFMAVVYSTERIFKFQC